MFYVKGVIKTGRRSFLGSCLLLYDGVLYCVGYHGLENGVSGFFRMGEHDVYDIVRRRIRCAAEKNRV